MSNLFSQRRDYFENTNQFLIQNCTFQQKEGSLLIFQVEQDAI